MSEKPKKAKKSTIAKKSATPGKKIPNKKQKMPVAESNKKATKNTSAEKVSKQEISSKKVTTKNETKKKSLLTEPKVNISPSNAESNSSSIGPIEHQSVQESLTSGSSLNNDHIGEITTEQLIAEIRAIETVELTLEPAIVKPHTKKNIFERAYHLLLRPFAPPLALDKIILPSEKVIESTLIIYFTEIQIIVGLLAAVVGFLLIFSGSYIIISAPTILIGILLILTSSGSEEVHVTNIRILVRKINLIDRLFRIPKDEQYLLRQIVSFQVGRAPTNRILAILSIILVIVAGLGFVSAFPASLMVIVAILTFLISLRLFKRSLTFSMSGGNNITIGIYKGVPRAFIDKFVETVLSITLQE